MLSIFQKCDFSQLQNIPPYGCALLDRPIVDDSKHFLSPVASRPVLHRLAPWCVHTEYSQILPDAAEPTTKLPSSLSSSFILSCRRSFWIVVLEKTLESPLDCNEIKPVNTKEKQPWIFIWRTDAEAEAPVLWPPDVKNWLIGKDPDAGKDWRQEKGTTED